MNVEEVANLLEKMEQIQGFIERHKNIDETLERMINVKDSIERFASLEQLIDHFKTVEQDTYLNKEVFSVKEAARYLGVSKYKIYQMSRKKEIPCHKPSGKLVFFSREDIVNWVKQDRTDCGE